MISTPLQKLPNIAGNVGKIIVATGLNCCPKCKKSPNLVILHTTRVCVILAKDCYAKIGSGGHMSANADNSEFCISSQSILYAGK